MCTSIKTDDIEGTAYTAVAYPYEPKVNRDREGRNETFDTVDIQLGGYDGFATLRLWRGEAGELLEDLAKALGYAVLSPKQLEASKPVRELVSAL